jgi:hypothetical protein
MIQKDYIMRMIEQMTKILARVLINREEGRREEALQEIENAFGKTVGIDPLLLDTLPIENIAEMFGILNDDSTGSVKCLVACPGGWWEWRDNIDLALIDKKDLTPNPSSLVRGFQGSPQGDVSKNRPTPFPSPWRRGVVPFIGTGVRSRLSRTLKGSTRIPSSFNPPASR